MMLIMIENPPFFQDHALTVLSIKQLREEGYEHCVAQFLKSIEQQKLDGFFIHLDLDVLNDELMPAVDSRTPDGFSILSWNSSLFVIDRSRTRCNWKLPSSIRTSVPRLFIQRIHSGLFCTVIIKQH